MEKEKKSDTDVKEVKCPNVNVNTDVGGIQLELDPECSWTWEARERVTAKGEDVKAMSAETILTRDLAGPPWPAQKQNTSLSPPLSPGQVAAFSNCENEETASLQRACYGNQFYH